MREFVMEAYKKEIEEGKRMFIKKPTAINDIKKVNNRRMERKI